MATNDIYDSEARYNRFYEQIDTLLSRPETHTGIGMRKYYCKVPSNKEYFYKIQPYFDERDLSYIRRIRLLDTLKLIVTYADKDLKDLEQEDLSRIMAESHKNLKSIHSKKDFVRHIRLLWRRLFPETDSKGRIDYDVLPYPIKHLSVTVDASKEKGRGDSLTWGEYERLLQHFSDQPRLKAYIAFATESLGRPQEILHLKIGDLTTHDGYILAELQSHGKTGLGTLAAIDSFPHLRDWLNSHPQKDDKNAYVFINTGVKNKGEQMTPFSINKHLRAAMKTLGIQRRVTAYSLKRNGVTFRRLRGDSDLEIQKAARWTSGKQLQTYDLSSGSDALKIELAKRGLIKSETIKPVSRQCTFCETITTADNETCPNCKRLMDREKAAAQEYKKETMLMRRVFESAEGQTLFEKMYKQMLSEKERA